MQYDKKRYDTESSQYIYIFQTLQNRHIFIRQLWFLTDIHKSFILWDLFFNKDKISKWLLYYNIINNCIICMKVNKLNEIKFVLGKHMFNYFCNFSNIYKVCQNIFCQIYTLKPHIQNDCLKSKWIFPDIRNGNLSI